jgi:drug/metabolite transporter (DMT)-like permease
MLAVALIYSINFFISKVVFADVSAFGVLAIRSITGIIFFVGCSLAFYRQPIPPRRDLFRMFICAITGITCNQFFFLWGLEITTELNAAILMITSPIFVFLIGYFLRVEKLTPRKILGVVLCFTGAAALILMNGEVSFGGNALWGDCMIVVNAVSYACYLVAVKPLNTRYSPIVLFGYLFAMGGLLNIGIGWEDFLAIPWRELSPSILGGIGFIAIFTTLFAYGLNAWAMKTVPPSHVAIYVYLQPVLVSLITVAIPSKAANLTLEKVLYMLIVFVGVGLVMGISPKATR